MTATTKPTTAADKPGGLIRSSMIFSGFTLISRLMGFVRNLAISYFMGASATFAADAFNAALSFPNLFRRIFAEGAFAAAFVPAYSRSLETDGEAVADELAADAMAVLAAATLAITVVAELTMPWLMFLIRPGFAATPEKYRLAVLLTQITMPYLPCMAIYAHLSGVLNARNRFILSGAAPILLNLWTLAAMLPTHSPVQAAVWASIGVTIAGVSQAGLLWWGVRKSGADVTLRWPRLTPQIKALIALAVPGAIGASVTQINVFVSGILVSHVNGAASWIAQCDNLYQLPQGLVGVAIGVALLPALSRAIHAGDHERAQKAMDDAIVFAMALTLPAATGLVSIPFFIVDALYTRGLFTLVDAHQTASALLQYGWGVPAFVLAQLFSRAFFARQDTTTPMRFALVSVAVNVALGITLFHFFGVAGIAAATASAWWLNVVMMGVTLARRDHYRPGAKAVSRLIRIVVANVALAVLLAGASHYRAQMQGLFGGFHVTHGLGPKEFAIALTVIVAAAIYPLLLFGSGGLTIAEARGALRRRKGDPPEGPADLP
ncbi:murein biosynthesis integral membrane protein MurJ [Phenylobacterium sp.]|uniref:murein biosynthesis integral membrane protein MurJ n=1 Tax=Phenylobacterium sp. TaxID=1871053 RepID=UPI002E2F9DC7|nr:murein biosynthesis integral membrane protein MurJ [Phenylobacterium sp.]HEX3364131.1 murein biosynthesis integral membrane protein MurJ [Phenylobacterium sp.]